MATSIIRTALLCLLAPVSFASWAERQQYALDPVHTRVLFAVDHAGFSHALGTVSGSTGTLDFDPDDLASACVRASVPLSRLELGDADWNAAATKLLDVAAYPVATFASTHVQPVDATHATVIGTLTLHGIGQEVRLDVTFNQLRRHPLPPFRRTAGFSATTTISRKAFGITQWPSVIGDAVDLRIEAEAVRTRGTRPDDAQDASSPTASPAGQSSAPSSESPAASPAPTCP